MENQINDPRHLAYLQKYADDLFRINGNQVDPKQDKTEPMGFDYYNHQVSEIEPAAGEAMMAGLVTWREKFAAKEPLRLRASHDPFKSNPLIFKEDYDIIKKDYDTIREDYNSLKGHYDRLEGYCDDLRKIYDASCGRYDTLKEYYDSLIGYFDSLKGSYDSLNFDYKDLKNNYDKFLDDRKTDPTITLIDVQIKEKPRFWIRLKNTFTP